MDHEPQDSRSILIRSAVCVLIPLAIYLLPAPAGLSPQAWSLFAVYLAAVLGIILRPYPEPVVLLAALGFTALVLGKPADALHGFGDGTPWLVFTAFIIGQCFIETGLGARIAHFLIRQFGRTSLRLGYVAMLTDLILAPATPSNTARTGGLVSPIYYSVANALGSKPDENPRRIGAYLSVLMYQNSLITATLFITAGAIYPLMIKMNRDLTGTSIGWAEWSLAMALPGAICLAIVPALVYRLFPPELKTIEPSMLASADQAAAQPMSRAEKMLAVLFVLAIVGWATGSVTKVATVSVALSVMALALLSGVISWDRVLKVKSAWSTLIWYAGIISLADALNKADFFKWMGEAFQRNVDLSSFNPIAVMGVLILITIVVRYFFASTIAFVVTFMPVIFTLGAAMKLPAIPLLLLCSASAQIASLPTHYGNAVGPVLFGRGYVDRPTWWKVGHIVCYLCMAIFFVVGLSWWKIIGLW
jgi:DASS family divalent anion:Na+ symporter